MHMPWHLCGGQGAALRSQFSFQCPMGSGRTISGSYSRRLGSGSHLTGPGAMVLIGIDLPSRHHRQCLKISLVGGPGGEGPLGLYWAEAKKMSSLIERFYVLE